MTRLVVDATVMVRSLVGSGPDGDQARSALASHDLHAPELVDLEVTSALRRLERTGTLPSDVALRALRLVALAPVQRHAHAPMLTRTWELRHNLTTYDAVYVALAELLEATLVTADAGLASAAGARCAVARLP